MKNYCGSALLTDLYELAMLHLPPAGNKPLAEFGLRHARTAEERVRWRFEPE